MTDEAGQEAEGRTDPRAAFYRAHHPKLVGYIRRRIGDQGEAEALAQETWIAFLRRFDYYQQVYDNPVGPLFVIARRKVADADATATGYPRAEHLWDWNTDLVRLGPLLPASIRCRDVAIMLATGTSDTVFASGGRASPTRAGSGTTPSPSSGLRTC
ncbi:RNA polymerase sigma factor [Streptomyces bullii]|uniref:RNA polymerase sigma factor n=1 Tax=Streptomyces bullii TaxID=349910 RepID=A0ABW0V3Y3_9ACTN